MTHVLELLPDYLAGELTPEVVHAVDRHLDSCPACRAELRQLGDTLVALVETLPEASAPPAVLRREVPPRRQPRATRAIVAVAASCLIAVAGWGWGALQQQRAARVYEKQQQVARWLSRPDVRTYALPTRDARPQGSLLVLPDGRALFVLLQEPPAGETYQAWGHRGGTPTSLGVFRTQVFEVSATGYTSVGVSLEPTGGSAHPTRPLGKVPLG